MDPMNSLPNLKLSVPASLHDKMRVHVHRLLPEEACGLLAGAVSVDEIRVHAVLPVENMLHSPVRFRMAPQAQLTALNWIDDRGYALVGIYHSHPTGPPHPSVTDLAEAYYPEAAYLIWHPAQDPGTLTQTDRAGMAWSCQVFRISGGIYHELAYHLVPDEQL